MDYTFNTINEWEDTNEEDYIGIDQILDMLRSKDKSEVEQKLQEETRIVFNKFDCLKCANCCKTTPPIFLQTDIKKISKFLGMPPKTFKRRYTIEDIDGTITGKSVPCPFLQSDHSCEIYAVRPQACRNYPHTDQRGFQFRNKMNKKNVRICPAALKIVNNVGTQF